MTIKATPSFSLKDQLFNKVKVEDLAERIGRIYPEFEINKFVKRVVSKFPELELLDRMYWMRDCLHEFLPGDYKSATKILLESLPPPCNPDLTDDDFGDFIYGPYGAYVAQYGCTEKHLQFSLKSLQTMTMRFSVEFPIRTFLNQFPNETMQAMAEFAKHRHYHVRRLASEGTRPKLPWAKKISINYRDPLPILDILYSDQTRFVTRSVANHMNDISKIDPSLVVKTLKRWKKEKHQTEAEMSFIIRHSLRTLEKTGHAGALQLLGYGSNAITLDKLQIKTKQVVVGDALEFSFAVTSIGSTDQKLLVDYHLYFQKANGKLAPKTFKISKGTISPGETLTFSKKQPLRPMTTRVLHPGKHEIELQINGITYPRMSFTLLQSSGGNTR